MSDLSSLSNEQLMALYSGSGASKSGGLSDMSDEELKKLYAQSQPVRPDRLVGQVAQNVNDHLIANTLGAPIDAAAWLLRKAGINADRPVGGSESIKSGIDYVATLPGRVSDAVSQGSFSPLTEQRTSRFEPANTAERIAGKVGAYAGDALGVMLPAAAIANTARAGTLAQGVASTLASQPVAQLGAAAAGGAVEGATDNPYAGMAASMAVPAALWAGRGLVSPVKNVLTPEQQRLAALAEQNGINLTAGQATGSKTLQNLEASLASSSGGSEPMQRTFQNQRNAFNSAVLDKAGVTADNAAPSVMERAFTNIGQTLDDLASRTTVVGDNKLVSDIVDVARNYGRRLGTDVAPVFKSYLEDLTPLVQQIRAGNNPTISGELYARIRSDIGKRVRQSSNQDLREALTELQKALDGAVGRSTSGSLAKEWKEARREYQALMTVDKAMQGGSAADRTAGNIPFSGLRQATVQGDRAGYARGRGQMNDLSRVGDFLANKVPDSATAVRTQWLNPMKWPEIAINRPISSAYNSPLMQRYLRNQVAGTTNLRGLYGSQAVQGLLGE